MNNMSSTTDADDVCALCGIAGGDNIKLKRCTACKLVQYCSVTCQKEHRPEHKRACKRRAREIREEILSRQPESSNLGARENRSDSKSNLFEPQKQNEECPICLLPLPLHVTEKVYMACCGQELCLGCINAADDAADDGRAPCPFCRKPAPTTEEENFARIRRRMELKDGIAYNCMGTMHLHGEYGFEEDREKAARMYLKAGELGSSEGHCNIGNLYSGGAGVEQSDEKAKHYYELAAIGGNFDARYYLGEIGLKSDIPRIGMEHHLIGAKAGNVISAKRLQHGYSKGYITKEEFTGALSMHKDAVDGMKSDQRQAAASSIGNPAESM